MVKANMKYTKMEDDDAQKWLGVLLIPDNWDKRTFDELLLVQHYAQKYEDYWFTRKNAYKGELLVATEPNVKLEGWGFRGITSTYKRNQFNIKSYIHGGSNGWTEQDGLLTYLEKRKERGEDAVFQEQVDECVRRLKIAYEKTLVRLNRFTEENVTEEYIRERLKKHLVSISQGNSNGFSTSFVNYTMLLERKEVGRWLPSVPILKPQPIMSADDIITYMQEGMSFNTLKRDGFLGGAITAAIPRVVSHYWEDTVAAIRLAETAARSWCAVWIELLGDEEE